METDLDIPSFEVIVPRHAIEAGEIDDVLQIFHVFMGSPSAIMHSRGQVDIIFEGYEDDPAELYEIPEVRTFVKKLDEAFPFWLFFLSKHTTSLAMMFFCFLPPCLNSSQQYEVFTATLNGLMRDRWFPAMEHIGYLVGLSPEEQESMVTEVIQYVAEGPLPMVADY